MCVCSAERHRGGGAAGTVHGRGAGGGLGGRQPLLGGEQSAPDRGNVRSINIGSVVLRAQWPTEGSVAGGAAGRAVPAHAGGGRHGQPARHRRGPARWVLVLERLGAGGAAHRARVAGRARAPRARARGRAGRRRLAQRHHAGLPRAPPVLGGRALRLHPLRGLRGRRPPRGAARAPRAVAPLRRGRVRGARVLDGLALQQRGARRQVARRGRHRGAAHAHAALRRQGAARPPPAARRRQPLRQQRGLLAPVPHPLAQRARLRLPARHAPGARQRHLRAYVSHASPRPAGAG